MITIKNISLIITITMILINPLFLFAGKFRAVITILIIMSISAFIYLITRTIIKNRIIYDEYKTRFK